MSALDQSTDTDLTAPGLSSIYENGNDESYTDLYEELSANLGKHDDEPELIHRKKTSCLYRVLHIAFSLTVLGSLGLLYNQVGQHIHDNHILVPQLASKPLNIGYNIINSILGGRASTPLLYAIEGVFFGALLPVFDKYVFKSSSKSNGVLDSSNIIPSAVAFLGVVFAVRKIEWTSSIQAAVAWSMLSPCLWFLLDGTTAGIVTGTLIGTLASISVAIVEGLPVAFYKDLEFIATMLWLGNFYFFGVIIFGKVGRYLFNEQWIL